MTLPQSSFSAVVMAGGHSTRMGRDKALLQHPTSGRTLVEHQLELLRQTGATELFVSVRTDQPMPDLPTYVQRVDDAGRQGPMAGIAATLECCRHAHLLVLAVDLPTMTIETLTPLLEKLVEGRGRIARSPTGLEPLVAVYPTAILPALKTTLSTGSTGLQRWLVQPDTSPNFEIMPFDDVRAFQNWNHPDQPIRFES